MKTPPFRHSPARTRLFTWFAILVVSWTAVQAHAAPVVSNLTAAQRADTRLVDVGYDVAAPGFPAVFIKLEASSDGGATWTVPVQTVSGDVGAGVTVGTGKAIVWDAGTDWPGNTSTQMRFRVTADDGFSLIPGGEFTMGRTSGDTDSNAPPVTVTVSSFYMQKTETTKAQWDVVRAWALDNGYSDLPAGGGKAANHPVHSVSWWNVVKWCNARSEMENLTPCYTVGGLVMKTGTAVPDVDWSADGYRLPTEAEWEKAARGGVEGKRFPWGTDTINHDNANYRANSSVVSYDTSGYSEYTFHPAYNDGTEPFTSPVGSFPGNNYNIKDCSGNLWEWCWDWHDANYYSQNSQNPSGPLDGQARVIRGGSWGGNPISDTRCSGRRFGQPNYWSENGGFRSARSTLTSDFAEIPGGTFTMGRTSGDSDSNAPPVSVTVSGFELQVTETTKAEWDVVRTWGLSHGYEDLSEGGGKGADHPVHTVNWFDAVKWCNARSEMEGLTPCYTVAGETFKMGMEVPDVDWSADGYRLPTEAEWERAARGGVSGKRFPWGDTIGHDEANFRGNSTAWAYDTTGYGGNTFHPSFNDGTQPYTSPVRSFAANGYGLYDMVGNVWEICWDWYAAGYYSEGVTDPRGPESGTERVYRGGAWNGNANYARTGSRASNTPDGLVHSHGLRPARNARRVEAATDNLEILIQADASIQFTSLVQVDDGAPRAVTFTSDPEELPFQLLYDGQATPPSAPGVYAVSASLDHPDYIGSGSATLTILGLSGKGQRILSGSTVPDASNGTDYGPVLLGGVSTRTFALANPGAQAVTLTGTPRVEIVGDHAGDFQVMAQPEAVLAGGGSLAFEVRFAPTQPGPRLAAVRVQSADVANGPLTFAIQGFGALPSLLAQTISFTAPASVFAGEGTLSLAASASSGLPVALTLLSGPATLDGNTLTLTGPGVVRVEARQQGGGNFAPAKPVARSITVRADPGSLTLTGLVQTYNGTPRAVTVLGVEDEAAVTYRVNGADTDQPPVGAGKYAVTAVAGAVTKKGTLTIHPAPVIVQPRDQRRWVGEANPPLTITFTGFFGGDDETLLTKPVSVKTTAKANSPAGAYPVTSSGGAATNYAFIHRPGTLVVEGFAGSYEALLRDPVSGLPAGRLLVTVPGTSRSASASLVLGGEVKAVPMAGTLDLDTDGRAAAGLFRRTQSKVSYEVEFHLGVFGEMTVTAARRNGESVAEAQDGIRLRDAAKGARVPQEGAYTAWLKAARPAAADVPEGDGWATAKLNAAGLLALAGRLGDATPFTASLPVDIQGGHRLFVQPYKPARAGAHLAGQWSLEEHPVKAGAWWLEAAELDWEKSPRDKDSAYRAGFAPVKVDLALDPWTVPGKTMTLGEMPGLTGGGWLVEHGATGSVTHGSLPTLVELGKGNTLLVLEPETTPLNARKWKAKITPATGMFSGSFELVEPTQKRKVSFTGVLRQTDEELLGAGHYLLPPLKAEAAAGHRTGILRFWKPE